MSPFGCHKFPITYWVPFIAVIGNANIIQLIIVMTITIVKRIIMGIVQTSQLQNITSIRNRIFMQVQIANEVYIQGI